MKPDLSQCAAAFQKIAAILEGHYTPGADSPPAQAADIANSFAAALDAQTDAWEKEVRKKEG